MLLPSLIGAAGSIGGSLLNRRNQRGSAAKESESYNERIARIERQRNNQLRDARAANARTQGYLNQVPETLKSHYGPYEEMGGRAIPALEDQYAQLLHNPEALLNQIGSGHRASPGYQFKTEEATRAANQAAAAAGMLGSPSHQQSLAKTVTGLADQDYYNYLQNALGLYSTGLSGTSGLNQMGYDAASNLGLGESNALLSQANLSHSAGLNEGMINRNAAEDYNYTNADNDMRKRREREMAAEQSGGLFGSLASSLGQIAPMFFGQGGAGGSANSGSYGGGNAYGNTNATSFFGGGGVGGSSGAFSRPDAFWTSRNLAPQTGGAFSQGQSGIPGNAFNQAPSNFRW